MLGGVAPLLDDEAAHLRTERAPPGVGRDHPTGRPHLAPGLRRDRGERRVLVGQIGLELFPDRAREGGTRAARRHRHREVTAAHEGRENEGAASRVVGGVDPDAALSRLARHREVDLARVGRDEREIDAHEIAGEVVARLVTDPPLGGQ